MTPGGDIGACRTGGASSGTTLQSTACAQLHREPSWAGLGKRGHVADIFCLVEALGHAAEAAAPRAGYGFDEKADVPAAAEVS